MIEINLLPEELRKKHGVTLSMPEIPARKVLIGGLAVFFAAQILMGVFAVFQKLEAAHLKQEVSRLKDQNHEIDRLKSETAQAKDRIRDIETLTEKKFYWAALLNSLSDSMIKGVWLKNFTLGEGQESIVAHKLPQNPKSAHGVRVSSSASKYLKLEGSAMSQGAETATIGKFIKQLKENQGFSEIFDDVQLSTINQRKIKDIDVYDFTLICTFKKDKLGAA